jgi:hypothetical protein
MKPVRIWALILCACFVSAAWSQRPASKGENNWSEFHRPNMSRWNPYEHVLNVRLWPEVMDGLAGITVENRL